MEAVRQLIDDTAHDRATADNLKPWYSYMCKRPAFHNDYLAVFNRPNVELFDTDGKGVSRLTATGVVANGTEYRVDTLIHATGFDSYLAVGLRERTGIELVGTDGQTLDHKWCREGLATLFGVHARGFPNLFFVGPVQAGVGVTWLHTAYAAGDHIAGVVAQVFRDDNYDVIEPSADASEDWARQSEEGGDARLQFHQSCSPGYCDNEGKPETFSARWAVYPKGVLEWSRIMRAWREEGSMKGMERR
jgi:cyclohexanone monooxygenase